MAIDQGTTSTRAILFDSNALPVSVAQRELEQHYPALAGLSMTLSRSGGTRCPSREKRWVS
jgi:hypothetical protein